MTRETTTASKKFEDGLSAFTKGEFGESISGLSAAIGRNPDKEIYYLTRGVAYMKTEKSNLAIDDFDKAIELNPTNRRAYHLRGHAFYVTGDSEKALHDFDKAIELDPEYGAAYLSRANLHTEMGNGEKAEQDMETVILLKEKSLGTFANEHNILRSRHLRMEAEGVLGEIDR
ncbi:MAG: tetratricopeptide repeat protein [Thermodesulfobacteriota bacterium]|nr:tetratricopeptide repeat protein [Thermodesulfobacteriota bacterium]